MSLPDFSFLTGGGLMGDLIRRKNWDETSLGTPDQWPSALKITINLVITAKFPMLLWWGPDFIQFYNDAYSHNLNDKKHPLSLGQPGAECWGEEWTAISKEINLVLEEHEGRVYENVPVSIYNNGNLKNSVTTYSLNAVRDEYGKNRGVLSICADTAHIAETRQKSEETQQQMLTFFEQSPVGIAIIDKENLTFRMANSFYGYLVGREPSELIDKPLLTALPELTGQGFDELLNTVIRTGEPYIAKEVEVKLLRNGQIETIFVDFAYQPRRENSNKISGIFVVVTDVTQQVASRRKIEDNENILRNMVLNAPIGVGLLNADDLVTEIVNESFIEVAGKSFEEIIGKNYWIPFAEAAPYYEEALNSVVRDGFPYFANEVPMMLIRHGKPENIYATFAYIPLKDTNDVVKKVAVWVLENTYQVVERKKIEEIVQQRTAELNLVNIELQESNGLLVRSNDNLERFAYIASHDLQEPLRKIQQFGSMLNGSFDDKTSREAMYLDRILVASVRMSALIRDILDFSKISHQRAVLVPVALDKIMKQVLVTLEERITESQASVIIDELPEILADPMQMDQLFQNLISNALKYRKPELAPQIMIRSQRMSAAELPPEVLPSRQSGHYYRIDIKDNGIGFDEQYLTRIFQMFQRLHGKNEFAGTGIGLAIAEKAAVNHGGAITAHSQPGQGSTFSVYLPVSR